MVSSKFFLPRKIQLAVLSAMAAAFASVPPAVAHHDPDGICEFDKGVDSVKCGELSKLIPVPKDAIHAGLAWTKASTPKICMGMRPSEYAGFHLTFKDADGHDQLFEPFRHFVYGGAGFSEGAHGLDESNTKGNTARENFVCWDITHADAFKQTDHFRLIDENANELVTKADFALNDAAFSDAGNSKGLDYNMFCSGNVALADGRWLFIGGHDKGGNNGIRKMTIFDPRDESWASRVVPPVKAAYLNIFDQLTPQSLPQDFPDFPNANNESNTDPADPSDMKYQRWYPSGALLPDETVLLVAGTDRNTSLLRGNPPGGCTEETRNTHVNCSLITQVVPEIYDPETDSTVALENARKHHNTYPRVYPVQTGNNAKDWKVAIIGEVSSNSLEKDANGKPILGRPLLSVARQYDPYTYTGKTYLLDVKAAKADSSRDTPAENYYQFVDQAVSAHNFGAGAQLWETDDKGHGVSQKVVLFGGNCSGTDADPAPASCDGESRDLIEMIDFQDSSPKYKQSNAKLYLPVQQNNTTVLPDGKVLISGGVVEGRGPWVNSFHLQLYDPVADEIHTLVDRKIAGHDHSTVALLPDGTVALLGGNATDLHGNVEHLDLGIPVAQIYKPPYLFKGARPEIKDAPEEISYHRRFNIQLSEGTGAIQSVALIAFGPVTHNWDWGKRYVKLWFEQQKDKLVVQAPAFPGLAVPMHYMLFVVDDKGVPSVAKLIQLRGTPAS